MQKKRLTKKMYPIEAGLQEKEAIEAARKCLSLRGCASCELCSLLCPELCITRDKETGQVQIDLEYCKGCGICASICPKGAIKMVLEEGL
jgi:2-oxoacid:acceptor oxidoreductase delta subunit (pyruvate/2-ketoisovalerate family)